uniref:Uncharacterized protein n=1 Tax=uncultured Armatimonadetes bacterium TaxID=157466 RepID=A0A6J4JUN7_9BACT|nr:FIG137478: Hypothetical protein [uncultured Armatimonadetes bacterium]
MALFHDLQALHAVHAVDSKILRARKEIAALDTGSGLAAEYNAAKAEAERLRAAAVKAQAEQHDGEMRLQSIEDKTKQVQKTLYSGTVAGPRELENLQKEIEMLGRQRGDAEETVLLAMDVAADRTKAADAAQAALDALAVRYRAVRNRYKERHAALTAEIATLETEHAVAAKPVPAALLTRYEGLRAKKGGIGAAVVDADGTCGACHTRLNTGLVDDAKAAASVQVCEYCGRILIPASFAAHG